MSRDPVIEELRALPEPPLPEAVWQRLDARRARRVAMRRGGVLSACVLAGGLAFVGFMPRGDEAIAPTALPESHLARAAHGESLSTIDRALQAAYARGASDDEVAPLWEVRRQLALSTVPSPSPF